MEVRGDDGSDGNSVYFATCDGSPQQKWYSSGEQIKSAFGGCLDVLGNNQNSGATVHLSYCDGTAALNRR